jgi:hypothetical protein
LLSSRAQLLTATCLTVLDRAIGGLEDMFRDPEEQDMLREQYSDWEFQSGQYSRLNRPAVRELLRGILGDDSEEGN